jgi:16S rRNA (uracil1498-N3)-methyltransferase
VSEPHWFIARDEDWRGGEVWLPPEESHHALRALRVVPPDVVTVINGRGVVARCAAHRVEDGRLVAEVIQRDERPRLRPAIAVYQGAAKGTKLDSAIERLAELGVAEVFVYESARAVARWDAAKVQNLRQRWDRIAKSAAKQSRNPFVLEAHGVLSWSELLRRVSTEHFTVALWEEAPFHLRTTLIERPDRVALVVGPEGGLGRDEAEALTDAGARLVSLGPRILRTENAAVVAASALLFHYGLIG